MTTDPIVAMDDDNEMRRTRAGRVFFLLLEMIDVYANLPDDLQESALPQVLSAAALLDISATEAREFLFGSPWANESLQEQREQLKRLLADHHEREQRARKAHEAWRVLLRGYRHWQNEQG